MTLTALNALVHTPVVAGALTGLITAAAVDVHAFKSWQSFHDAATYSWSTAAFRWFQGIVLGALTAAGLGTF